MALEKIKKANKKRLHESKRAKVRAHLSRNRQSNKVRRKRTRKMMLEGRREYMQKRKADKSYVEKLEAEINAES